MDTKKLKCFKRLPRVLSQATSLEFEGQNFSIFFGVFQWSEGIILDANAQEAPATSASLKHLRASSAVDLPHISHWQAIYIFCGYGDRISRDVLSIMIAIYHYLDG